MRTTYLSIVLGITAASLVALGFLGCSSDTSAPSGQAGGTSTGGAEAGGATGAATGGAGTGGSTTGGSVALGAGGAGTGGAGGSSAGGSGAGGSGAGGASGGTQNGTGGGTAAGGDCVSKIISTTTAAGYTPSNACAQCLCTSCGNEVAAVQGDPLSTDVSNCSVKSHCSGDCCFCGAICDGAGTNYRKGPCAAPIEKSAGIPSPSTTANYPALQTACDHAENVTSCRKPVNLAGCIAAHCNSQCPGLVPACP